MTFNTAADYTPEQTELIRAATLTAATITDDPRRHLYRELLKNVTTIRFQ
jgi:hypothetical protein